MKHTRYLNIVLLVVTGFFFDFTPLDAKRSNNNVDTKNRVKVHDEIPYCMEVDTIVKKDLPFQTGKKGGIVSPVDVSDQPDQDSFFNEQEYYQTRRARVEKLVKKGVNYFNSHSERDAFSAFMFDNQFNDGEIYLFVYNTEGICLVLAPEPHRIWENRFNYKDAFGNYAVQQILDVAQRGGGWLTYSWRNSTKLSYVQQMEKDGKRYAIGAGFYPHSKRDAAVSLVRGAAEDFKQQIARGEIPFSAFSKYSYPLGGFVFGDLYIYVLDFEGNIYAQGDRPGLIGSNSLEYKDSRGLYVNKEIIKKLKASSGGIWVEYMSKRARKITYAERVVDAKGKEYFIACGYYPEASRDQAVDLVRRTYQYMEGHGKSQGAAEVSSRTSDSFRYGDLYVIVYDEKGTCLADGKNPDNIGTRQIDLRDDDGKFMVKEIIKKAQSGGGWLGFSLKNAFNFVYTELVTLGLERLVIVSGLYPISKPEMNRLLVKSAASTLNDLKKEQAFKEFSDWNGRFIRGDLEIFVYDDKGICYVSGDEVEYIWKPMMNAKDETGKAFVRLLINTAKRGGGTVSYKEKGRLKVAYVEPVKKDGITYIVGSGFFK